ncbi:MAG: hypothetical protein ACREGL_06805 [Alphaproteobacteria bacterium]
MSPPGAHSGGRAGGGSAWSALAGVFALGLVVYCAPSMLGHAGALAEERVAPAPLARPGSWWLVRRAGGMDERLELKEVRSDGTLVTEAAGRRTLWTPEWNVLESPGPAAGATIAYRPHVRTFSFPLQPGKRWGGQVDWQAGAESGSWTSRGEAKGWESITVPAGRFDALRVEYEIDGQPWFACWYAVEVQYPIKCDYPAQRERSFELLDYRLAR